MKKKVVQLISFPSLYNDNLQNELKKYKDFYESFDLEVISLEDERNSFENKYGYDSYNKISRIRKITYLIQFNRYLKHKYTILKDSIVNIQFVSEQYVYLMPFIESVFLKTVISFWGSDLLRQSDRRLKMMKLLFRKSDVISFETEQMSKIFQEKVGHSFDKKIRLVKFGISLFSDIDSILDAEINEFKAKYYIGNKSKYVTLGYNRNKAHRHVEAIQSIIENNVSQDDIFIIIPWTYGPDDNDYKEQIINLINGKYEYVFLEQKLTDREIACLRKLTDILIQIQTTDSLSSTMLETLYAKKEVLTGSWLPYKELIDMGISMKLVNNTNSVGYALNEMLSTPLDDDSRSRNRSLINDMSSWSENIKKWTDLYK